MFILNFQVTFGCIKRQLSKIKHGGMIVIFLWKKTVKILVFTLIKSISMYYKNYLWIQNVLDFKFKCIQK